MFKTRLFEKWYDREIKSHCEVCHQAFEPEPGFYFGAMYVSYGFSVAISFVVGFVLFNYFGDPDLWVYVSTVTLILAFLWPVMYRYSRSIFLHIFGGISFDDEYTND